MERGIQRGAVRLLGGAETSRSVVFTLAELRQMTNNFSPYLLLGGGAFGEVYKGILTNGDVIAVKRFASTIKGLQDGHYENEAQHLMRLKHQNIVQLVGYCSETEPELVPYNGNWVSAEKPERLLCLEYMPNGNLRRYLSDETSGLEWNTRYNIIKGICRGLLYLHEEWHVNRTPIIHMDLKPENILLDDQMVPKIADFGLSRLFGEEQTRTYTINCKGTLGYMPPEYLRKGVITKKYDIFSLGVIVIEIITGLKNFPTDEAETASQQYNDLVLEKWRYRKAQGYTSQDIDRQQIKKCIEIGLLSIKVDPMKRPTIKKIIEMLERSDEAYQNEREQAPAFNFPLNQQHVMVASANAANRAGVAKSSGASNAMPPSASAHTWAANSGAAAAMNLSFANLQLADSHHGGRPYRGMATPGPAVPLLNGHVYSSPMLHPSQQQGAQQQGLGYAPNLPSSLQKHQPQQPQGLGYAPNLPSSSQKHQPQQSQGLGYAPNANAAAATASNSQKPFAQNHFFTSNTYAAQAPGTSGAAALGLYQNRSGDRTQQQAIHQQNAFSAAAGNNMKALHPSSGGSMHLSMATHISAGGVPHTYMSATQLTLGAKPNPLKHSIDQKPAAGK